MELSFLQLKQKDVICVTDGKNLGKVCDVTLSFPESDWLGITVTGCKGFKLIGKNEQFIPVSKIVQVGEDAVLVKSEKLPPKKCPPPCPPPPRPESGRRDFGEYE